MFKASESQYDRQIRRLLDELEMLDPTTEDYGIVVKHIDDLGRIRSNTSAAFTPDQVLNVAANLLGIVLIIRHEQFNVIASKALSFVRL
jgi:hypothetical protein